MDEFDFAAIIPEDLPPSVYTYVDDFFLDFNDLTIPTSEFCDKYFAADLTNECQAFRTHGGSTFNRFNTYIRYNSFFDDYFMSIDFGTDQGYFSYTFVFTINDVNAQPYIYIHEINEVMDDNGDDWNDTGDRIDLPPHEAEPLINAYINAFNDTTINDAAFCDTYGLGSDNEYCMVLREQITSIAFVAVEYIDPLYWVETQVMIDGMQSEMTFIVTFFDFDDGIIRTSFEIYQDDNDDNDNGSDPIDYVPDEDFPGNDYFTRFPESIRIYYQLYEEDAVYQGELAIYISDATMADIELHYENLLISGNWAEDETHRDAEINLVMNYSRGEEYVLIDIIFEYDYAGYYTIYVYYNSGAN